MSDAADRLARTRLAIVEHIDRRERRPERGRMDEAASSRPDDLPEPDPGDGPGAWFSHLRIVAMRWWRQHPASLALELATPALSAYASKKPVQFLGIAAAVGAMVVIARPWRLISVTGLIVALAKSSQLSGLVMSAMSAADFQRDPPPPR